MATKDKKEKASKGRKKKKPIKLYIGLGVAALLVLLIIWGMQSPKGGPHYVLCKTFAEMDLTYPSTMKVSEYKKLGRHARVYYTYTDAFGIYKLSMIRCSFKKDPSGAISTVMDKITIDRREIDLETINRFNKTGQIILDTKPDDTLPYPLGNDLSALKR